MTPGVSSPSSPGHTPGKRNNTISTTLEGLTSNYLCDVFKLFVIMIAEGHPSRVGLVIMSLLRAKPGLLEDQPSRLGWSVFRKIVQAFFCYYLPAKESHKKRRHSGSV